MVTASGVPYENMRPDQVVFMDLTPQYFGDFMPSSEWRMHYDIYKSLPDAQAVVHAHPTFCTSLACQHRDIPAFHHMVAIGGGKAIKCAEYATFGTQELSDNMLSALGPRRTVLLANHGMVSYGVDLDAALWLASITESLAEQYVSALASGTPPLLLSDSEMDKAAAKLLPPMAWITECEQQLSRGPPELTHMAEREKLAKACRHLDVIGVTQALVGSVSCRVPGGCLVTPSEVPMEMVRPELLVFIDTSSEFGALQPTVHWRLHTDIYRHFPEANAVVHTLSTSCTALASQRRGIPAFHYMVAAAGGKEIRCADYATIGTQELSQNMLSAMGSTRCALLANHGVICHMPNLDKAIWLANEVECLARQYLTGLSMGSARVLPNEEMDVMLAKFKTYGKQPKELERLSDFEQKHAIEAPPKHLGS